MDQILVLDFGSQYNQLIVRRFREIGVYSELALFDTKASDIFAKGNVKGIVLSGGPHSVYDTDSFGCDPEILQLGIPVLGICYGMQWLVKQANGKVESAEKREYGRQSIAVSGDSPLFAGTPETQNVWMSHGDRMTRKPEDYRMVAVSETGVPAGIEHQFQPIYGVQFHPEVEHSEYGMILLKNFAIRICHAKPEWTMDRYIETEVERIQKKVGSERVLMGVSGGVDSSVAAVLIHRAIGANLTCMFIDHGLLRKNEAEEVQELFQSVLDIPLYTIDASERFLSRLANVTDPEKKRKIIGSEFVHVFDEESSKLGNFAFLGQGTLYTDVIESGTKTAQTIKSHHNVGGLPKEMKFQLIEPLNRLFKDEVRVLGTALGMPERQINRIPFPGPGLAIRIIGDITKEKLTIVRESDAILQEEIRKAGLNRSIWQYFTLLPGISTVGVMGDQRTYCHTVAIRAVTSHDGMTADWARIPYDTLEIISRRIVNEVAGVNRVVYDITSKPPATIEWE